MNAIEIHIGAIIKQEAFFILTQKDDRLDYSHTERQDFNDRTIVVTKENISFIVENIKSYSGIPLTEEWLLKFNLKLAGTGLSISYGITTEIYHFEIMGYCVKIDYVHQLQNLYHSLTGNELTYV